MHLRRVARTPIMAYKPCLRRKGQSNQKQKEETDGPADRHHNDPNRGEPRKLDDYTEVAAECCLAMSFPCFHGCYRR